MIANVQVPPEYDLVLLAQEAGQSDTTQLSYSEGRFYIKGITQAALDAALLLHDYADLSVQKKRERARDAIDLAAGRARSRFTSPGDLVDQEYRFAADAAKGFKDQGYVLPAPDCIQSWADVTGMTAQEAADDILATEAQWKQVAALIRRTRFEGRKAVDETGEDQIESVRDSYIAQLALIRPENL